MNMFQIDVGNLPMDLVNQICLYTGKFRLINDKLMSLIEKDRYNEVEKTLTNKTKYTLAVFLNMERLVMRLYNKKNGVRSNEERMRDHLEHTQKVIFERHPLLFTKDSPIENVMIPETHDTCMKCAVEIFLSKRKIFHINDPKKGQCIKCMRFIRPETNAIKISKTQPPHQKYPRQPFYSRVSIRSSCARKN